MDALRKYKAPTALIAAVLMMLINVLVAFAHHNTYDAWTDCQGNWGASAFYVGGGEKRLVLVSMVEVNGVLYDPDDTNWSEAPAGYTGGVIPRSEYGGSTNGLPAATDEDYLWVGVSNGWKIFDRSGTNFVPNPGNWEGTIKMFSWNGSKWIEADSDDVWQPTPPGDCPKPKAKIEYACGWEALKVTFKNEGGGDADFTWKINGVEQEALSVGANSEKVLHPPIGEDETLLIEINGPNGYTKSQQITRNCAGSDVTATYVCGEDTVPVTFINTSAVEQTFSWTINHSIQSDVVVAPNSQQVVNVPITEDQVLDIEVTGPNSFSKSLEVRRNCEGSEVTATHYCGESSIILKFKNTSNVEQTYQWTRNTVPQTQVVVAPNSEKEILVPIAEDETVVIEVTGPNGYTKHFEITRNCAGSAVTLTYQCGEDTAKLKLVNSSDLEQLYQWWLKGDQMDDVRVEPNSTKIIEIPINEDQTINVEVTGPNDLSESFEVTRNCEGSDASVSYACGEDHADLVLINSSSVTQTYEVKLTGNPFGAALSDVVVSPMSNSVYVIPIIEDQSFLIEVSGPNGFTKTLNVKRDCEEPLPAEVKVDFDLTYECGQGMATATFTNTGTTQQTFVFSSTTVSQAVVVVEAGQSVTRSVPINEDQTVTATVTVQGSEFTKTVSVTRDCAANPSVEVVAECKVDEKQFKVYLNNTGGDGINFTVMYINETNEHFVSAHNVMILALSLPERSDQSYSLKITAPGMEPFEAKISGCGQPTNLPETEQPHQFDVTILLPFTAKD